MVRKCAICGEVISKEDMRYAEIIPDKNAREKRFAGRLCHEACYVEQHVDAKIWYRWPGGFIGLAMVREVDVIDYGNYDPEYNEFDADTWEIIKKFAKRVKWISTDGWRGYYTIKPVPRGWVRVEDDWCPTIPDRYTAGRYEEAHSIFDLVNSEEINIDFPVIFIQLTTSNLFSVGYEVFVPAGHEDEWEALKKVFP